MSSPFEESHLSYRVKSVELAIKVLESEYITSCDASLLATAAAIWKFIETGDVLKPGEKSA